MKKIEIIISLLVLIILAGTIVFIFVKGLESYSIKKEPINFTNIFIDLEKTFSTDLLKEFKETPEDQITSKYHFSLGLEIRNRYGLWQDSELEQYFRNMGITHPDQMSSVILINFHRYLNEKPYSIEPSQLYLVLKTGLVIIVVILVIICLIIGFKKIQESDNKKYLKLEKDLGEEYQLRRGDRVYYLKKSDLK